MGLSLIGSSAREPAGRNSLVGNLKYVKKTLELGMFLLKAHLSWGSLFNLVFQRKVTFSFIGRHYLLRSLRDIPKILWNSVYLAMAAPLGKLERHHFSEILKDR
jgi:hypothetical protein